MEGLFIIFLMIYIICITAFGIYLVVNIRNKNQPDYEIQRYESNRMILLIYINLDIISIVVQFIGMIFIVCYSATDIYSKIIDENF